MNIYRFSPINSQDQLGEAWKYLVRQLLELSKRITGEQMPVTVLKLFTHYPQEYEYLSHALLKYGAPDKISSRSSLYVKVDRTIGGQQINYLGVRIVDPYRMQVGCGDYEVEDYEGFLAKWKSDTGQLVRQVTAGSGSQLIELWDPDLDVLGYVIRPLAGRD